MARKDVVAVWAIDGKSILTCVSEEKAFEMSSEEYGDGELKYRFRSERKYGKDYYSLQLKPHPKMFKSSNSSSPTSITCEEMRANGLAHKYMADHEEVFEVQSAVDKIAAWPTVFNERAVSVVPRV